MQTKLRPLCSVCLGEAALECLEIELAISVYRKLRDASMVLNLESISHYEDRNLLAGHAMILLGRDVNVAQVTTHGCNPFTMILMYSTGSIVLDANHRWLKIKPIKT